MLVLSIFISIPNLSPDLQTYFTTALLTHSLGWHLKLDIPQTQILYFSLRPASPHPSSPLPQSSHYSKWQLYSTAFNWIFFFLWNMSIIWCPLPPHPCLSIRLLSVKPVPSFPLLPIPEPFITRNKNDHVSAVSPQMSLWLSPHFLQVSSWVPYRRGLFWPSYLK